jgi:hypothetical protein
MMTKHELGEFLASEDMQPFWQEVRRIRDDELETMMQTENCAYVKAVKALDRVLHIPARFK